MSELKTFIFKRILDNDLAKSLREMAEGFGENEIYAYLLKIEFEGKTVYGCWSDAIMIGESSQFSPLGEAARMALERLSLEGEILYCPIPMQPNPERSTLEKTLRRVPNDAKICFVVDLPKLFWLLIGMFNVQGENDPDAYMEWLIHLH